MFLMILINECTRLFVRCYFNQSISYIKRLSFPPQRLYNWDEKILFYLTLNEYTEHKGTGQDLYQYKTIEW